MAASTENGCAASGEWWTSRTVPPSPAHWPTRAPPTAPGWPSAAAAPHGWTAAASLTATDLYACGTISYPILDLTGWATGETHDFESRYLDSLIGPLDEVPDRYRERSPLHRADRIAAPFLLLQGLDDVICPPSQCERFLAEVAGRGIPHAYLSFPGEGHGFRRAETIVRAVEAELALYTHTFGIARDDVPALELRG